MTNKTRGVATKKTSQKNFSSCEKETSQKNISAHEKNISQKNISPCEKNISQKNISQKNFSACEKKIPQRRCVACREMKNKNSLFRIVATADGKIFFDADGKAQGRGAYICKNPDCLQKTQKSKGLERSLKRVVPSEIFMVLGR